jgi:hypothetical protein
MKKILVAVAAVVIMAGSAFAATQSGDVPINATIGTVGCHAINVGNLALTIADPAIIAPSTSVGIPTTIQCQPSALPYAVTVSSLNMGGFPTGASPLTGLLVNGANSLSYDLVFNTSFAGVGFGGAGKNITLIAAGGATATPTGSEPAGIYSDTITVTVTY